MNLRVKAELNVLRHARLLNHDLNWIDAHGTRARYITGATHHYVGPRVWVSTVHHISATQAFIQINLMCSLIYLSIERARSLRTFEITFVKNSPNALSTSPFNCEPVSIPIGQVVLARKSCNKADIIELQ